jgi:glutathione peroxidase
MKILLIIALTASLAALMMAAASPEAEKTDSAFHEFEIAGLLGDQLNMGDFAGKYVLCVNVASKCGYTPQYEPLQQLYEQHQDKLVVIGFPCNQFLGQEPGEADQIATFCEKNYGVTFPMTEKIKVKGKEQHPIYAWLTQKELNGVADAKVSWNFNKFLISPDGEWLGHFASGVDPLSEEIVGKLK